MADKNIPMVPIFDAGKPRPEKISVRPCQYQVPHQTATETLHRVDLMAEIRRQMARSFAESVAALVKAGYDRAGIRHSVESEDCKLILRVWGTTRAGRR